MEGAEIRQRFEANWTLRKTIEQSWDLVSRYVQVLRGGDMYREYTSEHAVEYDIHRREVFDSTAIMASQNLAASLHSGLTTPLVRWFALQFRDDALNQMDAANEWLEECADICWQELQQSNFNLEANECYLDLVSYGTAPIIEEIDTDDNGDFLSLDFKSLPVRETYFEQDHRGQIYRLYRRLEWTALMIVDKFGEAGVPEEIVAKSRQPAAADERIDVIFCVYRREKYRDADTTKILPAEKRPFGMKYILRSSAEELGEEGGYYEMPAFLPRWRKTSGSQWGHSPAMVVMGDILTLNDMVSMQLDALEKNIDPPTLVTERGLLSDRDLTAGGLTVMRNIDDMKAFESTQRLDWIAMEFERLQRSIRQAFFVDQLELKESPAMTATEVQVRYELMQRLLGPTLGRLQSDFLDPLIERTFYTLMRHNRLPPLPEEISAQDSDLDIAYLSPMARAQKSDEVASVERWVGMLAGLAGSGDPRLLEMLDYVDRDKLPAGLADTLGVPADYVRSDAEVKKDRDERKKAMEEQRRVAMAQQAGDAAQSMAKAGQEAVVNMEAA